MSVSHLLRVDSVALEDVVELRIRKSYAVYRFLSGYLLVHGGSVHYSASSIGFLEGMHEGCSATPMDTIECNVTYHRTK